MDSKQQEVDLFWVGAYIYWALAAIIGVLIGTLMA